MQNNNIKNLKKEYKDAKKNANFKAEKKEMKSNYKKAKGIWKEYEMLNKKYKLDETPKEFWERQNISTFDEFMKNNNK